MWVFLLLSFLFSSHKNKSFLAPSKCHRVWVSVLTQEPAKSVWSSHIPFNNTYESNAQRREQSRLEGIMKTQLFLPPPLYWWHKRSWRESTVTFRRSGFFCATGSAVISSTVTHSCLSHRELFLDDFFRVASNEAIDKSKFLTSRLPASCVFKRTFDIPPSAFGPPPLCGSEFYSYSACKCWLKSLLGWSSFYETLRSSSSRFLVWK